MVVIYNIKDLLFSARIEESCKRSSAEFRTAQSIDQLTLALKRRNHVLIVCDLVSAKADLDSIKKMARESGSEVIGYYPHVDKDTASYAHSLDVEYITPRSAFQSKLTALLR